MISQREALLARDSHGSSVTMQECWGRRGKKEHDTLGCAHARRKEETAGPVETQSTQS